MSLRDKGKGAEEQIRDKMNPERGIRGELAHFILSAFSTSIWPAGQSPQGTLPRPC